MPPYDNLFSQSPQQLTRQEIWMPYTKRTTRRHMAILTGEIMEIRIQRTPDARGMLDSLPVANHGRNDMIAILGWRQKLGTWPNSKHFPYKFKDLGVLIFQCTF